jgi:hypothetical protein
LNKALRIIIKMMNSFSGMAQQSNRYHELQNLIKGVPI